MEFTPEKITELKDGEIFVFGSNLSGIHGAGAAQVAHKKFGAMWGKGWGHSGKTYAIPTKNEDISRTLDLLTIKDYVDDFISFARVNPLLKFYVTEIGCGLAGLKPYEIAPLFISAISLQNVILPKRFYQCLVGKE